MNYMKTEIDFFEIGSKWQLELLLPSNDNRSSSRVDHDDHHYYYYDAEDEGDSTNDEHVTAVICIDYAKRMH